MPDPVEILIQPDIEPKTEQQVCIPADLLVLEEWRSALLQRLRSRLTASQYIGSLRKFAVYCQRGLAHATVEQALSFIDYLIESGTQKQRVSKQISRVQSFLDWREAREGRTAAHLLQLWRGPKEPWTASLLPLLRDWHTDLQASGKAANTCTAYLRDLNDFTAFVHGNLEAVEIDEILEYRRHMQRWGVTITTHSRRVSALTMFIRWLRMRQRRPFVEEMYLQPPRRSKRIHRWWTEEQVEQFRAAFKGESPTVLRDRAMMELGLSMGLRVSEITGLDRGHLINFSDPYRAGVLLHRKGDKEQLLPFSEEAHPVIVHWLSIRPSVPTEALFFRMPFQHRRERLCYQSVEKIFKHYAALAGVPVPKGTSMHHLRHTFGQQCSELGLGIEETQKLLGHTDPATTQKYYEVSDWRSREAMQRVHYRTHQEPSDETPPPRQNAWVLAAVEPQDLQDRRDRLRGRGKTEPHGHGSDTMIEQGGPHHDPNRLHRSR